MLHLQELINDVQDSGGFAITHVGRVSRLDGSVFNADRVDDLLYALYFFLSFCRGFWAQPLLPVGFDAQNERVCEQWSLRILSRWEEVFSWFSRHEAQGLSDLFPGFLAKWKNPLWRDVLSRSIWWYLSANLQGGGTDGGVILAQVALELLSWNTFVEDEHVLSKRGFEDLPAADKLRLLLSRMKVPLQVPPALGDLAAFGSGDVPYAAYKLVEVRNALVHPKNRAKLTGADVVTQAWILAIWYLELAILHACNYSGTYLNRCGIGRAQITESVPWK